MLILKNLFWRNLGITQFCVKTPGIKSWLFLLFYDTSFADHPEDAGSSIFFDDQSKYEFDISLCYSSLFLLFLS